MNALTLKTLLLSVITEIKFGTPLAKNAIGAKNEYKKLVGLPKNAKNEDVLNCMHFTYLENGIEEDFLKTVKDFKVEHLVNRKYLVK